MKIQLIALILILIACEKQDEPCEMVVPCTLTDDRFVGTWVLVKECNCYNFGGDFVWRDVPAEYIFSFDDRCGVSTAGTKASQCNKGVYSIENDMLEVNLKCPSGGTINSPYKFEFKSDTLILKGRVDEGYIGSKYVKK